MKKYTFILIAILMLTLLMVGCDKAKEAQISENEFNNSTPEPDPMDLITPRPTEQAVAQAPTPTPNPTLSPEEGKDLVVGAEEKLDDITGESNNYSSDGKFDNDEFDRRESMFYDPDGNRKTTSDYFNNFWSRGKEINEKLMGYVEDGTAAKYTPDFGGMSDDEIMEWIKTNPEDANNPELVGLLEKMGVHVPDEMRDPDAYRDNLDAEWDAMQAQQWEMAKDIEGAYDGFGRSGYGRTGELKLPTVEQIQRVTSVIDRVGRYFRSDLFKTIMLLQ